MALIDELKEKRADFSERMSTDIKVRDESWERFSERIAGWEADIADLDRAIAALAPDSAGLIEEDPDEFEDFESDDTPAEHISDLTGDPAIEPETGLHGEEAEKQMMLAAYFDGRNARIAGLSFNSSFSANPFNGEREEFQRGWHDQDEVESRPKVAEEQPALNPSMQDEREEPVALAQPEWNEPQPTEGYAPVTSPEADALARAHDYYSPEKIAERNRFNPFAMFRREPEDA